MATLALSFKGRHLSIYHLDDKPTTIGRNADCRICIDSLAVAPLHAELIPTNGDYLLLALDPDYPVLMNNEQVDQASLRPGDLVQIGKHTLRFCTYDQELDSAVDTSVGADTHEETDAQAPRNGDVEQGDPTTEAFPAYLQIQSGCHIGQIVVIRHTLTRLKYAGTEGVVVARKGNSYRLVRQEKQANIFVLVDGTPLGDETSEMELQDGSLIEINEVCLRFFMGQADQPKESTKSPA